MSKRTLSLLSASALLMVVAAATASAEDGEKRCHPHGPPPEAITACENHEAGDACSVTTPDDKTIAGVCRGRPDGGEGPLACVPNGPPPGPPPEGR